MNVTVDEPDEIEEMRQDALRRGEAGWRHVAGRLAAHGPTDSPPHSRADSRAVRIGCLMLHAEVRPALGSRTKGKGARTSIWMDRGERLEDLDAALAEYVAGFPVGVTQDVPWALEARHRAAALAESVREELQWRERVGADDPVPGVAALLWRPSSTRGPRSVYPSIAVLARQYHIDASDLAILESVARLPVEPFAGDVGPTLLRRWDPNGDDTLYLPKGDPRFDSWLRDTAHVRRWERRLR